MYHPPKKSDLQGRIDGQTPDLLRWHQALQELSLEQAPPMADSKTLALLGYACDEGVRRNQGRIGAAQGPTVLRKILSSLPAFGLSRAWLHDAGTCFCEDGDLESAREVLSEKTALLLRAGYTPMLLGGGHEIAYAHYKGIRKVYPEAKLGIINFDAHFDLRPIEPQTGESSGTGFWQMAQEESDFRYLALGIRKMGNTSFLFELARRYGVQYLEGEVFDEGRQELIEKTLEGFIRECDLIYLTVCLDVFAAPYAPGVSAPAYRGLVPDALFWKSFRQVLTSPKFLTMDIAELNPSLDLDYRTARLAAALVYEAAEVLLGKS